MSDLISRADVIELFEKYKPRMAVSVYEYGQALKAIPSAEQKIGKWLEHIGGISHELYYFCDQCYGEVDTNDYDFCPNCGAKMCKGGDSE